MIGGTDIVLCVHEDIPTADVIFRAVRQHWPAFVFQNADDESAPFSPRTELWLPQPSGPEFFIYRDEQAARNWDEDGATPENANTMLHVILGKRRQPQSGLRSLTLVCGTLTGDMKVLIDDIRAEVTLESLARRVEALERLLHLEPASVCSKDWWRVVGMFGDSEFMKQVDAEGQTLREVDRAEAQRTQSAE
jgi:hypothetical protein